MYISCDRNEYVNKSDFDDRVVLYLYQILSSLQFCVLNESIVIIFSMITENIHMVCTRPILSNSFIFKGQED